MGGIILGCAALPIGFAALPSIFAMRNEVIRRVHRIMKARNGSRSGRDPFNSDIFADDAIFAESDIVDMPTESVEGWGGSRRGLF